MPGAMAIPVHSVVLILSKAIVLHDNGIQQPTDNPDHLVLPFCLRVLPPIADAQEGVSLRCMHPADLFAVNQVVWRDIAAVAG